MKRYLVIFVAVTLLTGCATLPQRVNRPWNRTLNDTEIPVGASISVTVESQSTPLIGSDELVSKQIKAQATELLARRGFQIVDNNPQYELKVLYKTETNSRQRTSITTRSGSYLSANRRSTAYGGWGVMLAQAMSSLTAMNVSSTNVTQTDVETYTHMLTSEIYTPTKNLVWINNAYLESGYIDILSQYAPLLQIAFSSLPSANDVIPRVEKLKENRFYEYMDMHVKNNNFMCPALPNYIMFGDNRYSSTDPRTGVDKYAGYKVVSDKQYLLAFLDLLEAAEYALPGKSEKEWKIPRNPDIWKNVTLIGRYLVGNDEEPVNVVIRLQGTQSAYIVKKCELVSDADYIQYQTKYQTWIDSLTRYYDFYER